jgi:hypothetical protein
VKTATDARAICVALEKIARNPGPPRGMFDSALHAATRLFQDVRDPGCAAFPIMSKRGCSILVHILDEGMKDLKRYATDDLLFILKILALYCTRKGTEAVIRAARLPLEPDDYMWSVIFRLYEAGHPHSRRLFGALSRPLPTGFMAVALMDAASQLRLSGGDLPHPYDSDEGTQRLERWLRDPEAEHFNYAHSATAALPFIDRPERDRLLALALDHPSAPVQLEAAWAAAKLGREAGLRCLTHYCRELNHSKRARQYLAELHREDLIPPEARTPDFEARADFAEWLAHPNELGRAPDEVDVIDHRDLGWPPDRERRPFWLIKYRLRKASVLEEDDVDVGLVGSITFCLFSYSMGERPPEDCYAIHCYWEMEQQGLISETTVDEGSDEYDPMLRQWQGGPLDDPKVTHVAELSPGLGYPQRLVALASGRLAGEEGWVVLDGPRCAWYARAGMPTKGDANTVLMLHVGRELLGFREQPDRKRFLAPTEPGPAPEQIIEAYERLVDEACSGTVKQQEKLLCHSSLLGSALDAYVTARAASDGRSNAAVVAEVYERLLAAAGRLPERLRGEAFDSFQPLGARFETYRDALLELGRRGQVLPLVNFFAPYWDHNRGYGMLATAAFKAGEHDVAERFCLKLRTSLKEWYRSEEMGYLAEIWHQRGRAAEAKELLVVCLRELLAASRQGKGSDKKVYEDWFQRQRSVYLRLFPESGAKELEGQGIPATTLR